MYKVLIVDDDIVIRHDLKLLIDWAEYDCMVIAEAGNGSEALELICSEGINLVVTDIYMPVMDGVELIRRAKNESPNTEFIVISNYDEFKYVKDAMKFGAYDYLLKYEIDAKTFHPIVKSIKEVLDGHRSGSGNPVMESNDDWRHILEEKYWRNVLTDQSDTEAIQSGARKLGIDINPAPFMIILLNANDPGIDAHISPQVLKELDSSISALAGIYTETFKYSCVLRMEESLWAIIIKPGEISQSVVKNSCFLFSRELTKGIKEKFNIGLVLAMGEVILKPDEFQGAYKKTRDFLDYKFYYGLDAFIDTSYIRNSECSFDESELESLRKTILEDTAQMNFELANQHLDSILEKIKNLKPNPEITFDYFALMLYSLKETLKGKGITPREEKEMTEEKRVRSLRTLKSIELYLRGLLNGAEYDSLSTKCRPCRQEVSKAIGHIRKNYMKNLTLENVSLSAGISKNYLCRLFKEETGENFIEYLNRYRIERAQDLISGSDKSMKEIAALVGLDYTYFCRVFRNTVGKKPSELR